MERFEHDDFSVENDRMKQFGELSARAMIAAIQEVGTEQMHKVCMVGDFSMISEKEQSTRESLKQNPKDPYGWWLLGHTLLKREDFDEALECLEKSAKQFEHASYVWRDIGIVHKRTGNVSKARDALVKSIELESPMVDPESLYEMAGILIFEEDYNGALELLQVQQRHTPEDPEMYKHVGHCAMHLGRLNEAITVYDWIVSKNSKDVEAWKHLGYLYCQEEEWDKAERALRRANQLSPDDCEISMNFGAMFHRTGRLQASVKSYRKATRLEPENSHAWISLGIVYRDMDEHDKSHSAFVHALELDPDSEIAAAGLVDADNALRM